MADTYCIGGHSWPIQSWDGGRLNTKAHGPGTLVDEYGDTRQCLLNQGVISGYSWVTGSSGNKCAQVYNTHGIKHGPMVAFSFNGDIWLSVFKNGEPEGSRVKGMTCIQYMSCYSVPVLKDLNNKKRICVIGSLLVL